MREQKFEKYIFCRVHIKLFPEINSLRDLTFCFINSEKMKSFRNRIIKNDEKIK